MIPVEEQMVAVSMRIAVPEASGGNSAWKINQLNHSKMIRMKSMRREEKRKKLFCRYDNNHA